VKLGGPELVALVASCVVLAADVAFIALNHAWTAWRRNPWGRHVMLFSYVIAALLALGLARLVLGDYPWRRHLIAAFYCALALVMCQRVWLVVREHRAGRRHR
jgi:hypothetical protein